MDVVKERIYILSDGKSVFETSLCISVGVQSKFSLYRTASSTAGQIRNTSTCKKKFPEDKGVDLSQKHKKGIIRPSKNAICFKE